jgi:hypothetical protein
MIIEHNTPYIWMIQEVEHQEVFIRSVQHTDGFLFKKTSLLWLNARGRGFLFVFGDIDSTTSVARRLFHTHTDAAIELLCDKIGSFDLSPTRRDVGGQKVLPQVTLSLLLQSDPIATEALRSWDDDWQLAKRRHVRLGCTSRSRET